MTLAMCVNFSRGKGVAEEEASAEEVRRSRRRKNRRRRGRQCSIALDSKPLKP